MNKYALQSARTGLFFVTNRGFVASTAKTATQYSYNDAYSTMSCLLTAGLES